MSINSLNIWSNLTDGNVLKIVHFSTTINCVLCRGFVKKWSHSMADKDQRLDRDLDRGNSRGWVVSSSRGRNFPWERTGTQFKEGWVTPGPVWTDGRSRPHRDSIPTRPARRYSLYQLRYRPSIWLWNGIYFGSLTETKVTSVIHIKTNKITVII